MLAGYDIAVGEHFQPEDGFVRLLHDQSNLGNPFGA